MIRSSTDTTIVSLIVIMGVIIILSPDANAVSTEVVQVESFIRNIIKVIAGLAGLIATAFFVIGGLGYITSSGNPEHMERSKRTLIWAGVGLAIVIAAFVISNIIVAIATNSFGS